MYFFITFVFLNGFLNNITQIAGYLFNTIFQTKEKSYLCIIRKSKCSRISKRKVHFTKRKV